MRGGQDSQNPHNIEAASRSLLQSLEPSLWNSKIGRRQFVKRTGAATVGTLIALHGFRTELLASHSSTPTCGLKNVRIHYSWTCGGTDQQTGTSTKSAADAEAQAWEMIQAFGKLHAGYVLAAAGPGDMDNVSKCATAMAQAGGYSSGGTTPVITNVSHIDTDPQSPTYNQTIYECVIEVYTGNQCWLQFQYVQDPQHPVSAKCVP